MQEQEIWKDIPGYEGLYQASTHGRIKSLPKWKNGRGEGIGYMMKERILRPQKNGMGYLFVRLATMQGGQINKEYVHRLIALTFIPNPQHLPQINHKSEIKTENFVNNLEWCDAKYNMNYNNKNMRSAKCHCVPVLQYSLDGMFIQRFESMSDAAESLGKPRSYSGLVSNCCRGVTKQSLGYVWKYAE